MKLDILNDLVAANTAQNIIISVEIVIAAIAQSYAFSYKAY